MVMVVMVMPAAALPYLVLGAPFQASSRTKKAFAQVDLRAFADEEEEEDGEQSSHEGDCWRA